MKNGAKIFTSIILMFFNNQAQSVRELNPFSRIGRNSTECFSGSNLIFHGLGIISTYALINSGVDCGIHNFFAENSYSSVFDPAVGIGYLMPVVLSGGIYLFGNVKNSSPEIAAGSAALQAALVSLTFSTLLKTFTGRPNPDPWIYNNDEASREFFFGFLRGGIHYGWPSGHLCTNTAVITCLIYFYKNSIGMKIAGSIYLSYLFYGIMAHDNNTMHWFSDIVAGLLMGYAIGSTIGKNFRDEMNKNTESVTGIDVKSAAQLKFSIGRNKNFVSIIPVIAPDYKGFCIRFSL